MAPFARTPRLAAYVAPAHPRAELWRLALGVLLLIAFMLAGGAAVGFLGLALRLDQADLAEAMMMNTPLGALAALASFGFWWAGLWLILRSLHRRPFGGLYGPRRRIEWGQFGLGAAGAFGLAALASLSALAFGGEVAFAERPLAHWAATALVALPLIFVQTGAEELLFRGYLTQQLAARFRSPLIWAVAPALLFGALHWNPIGYGSAVWLVIAVTALTGFGFTLAVAHTGGLSLAMGLHFGLNAQAFLLVSPGGFGSGLGLMRWTGGLAEMERLVWVDLAWVAAAVAAALWWVSRDRRAG